jgi:hypothetical protein
VGAEHLAGLLVEVGHGAQGRGVDRLTQPVLVVAAALVGALRLPDAAVHLGDGQLLLEVDLEVVDHRVDAAVALVQVAQLGVEPDLLLQRALLVVDQPDVEHLVEDVEHPGEPGGVDGGLTGDPLVQLPVARDVLVLVLVGAQGVGHSLGQQVELLLGGLARLVVAGDLRLGLDHGGGQHEVGVEPPLPRVVVDAGAAGAGDVPEQDLTRGAGHPDVGVVLAGPVGGATARTVGATDLAQLDHGDSFSGLP